MGCPNGIKLDHLYLSQLQQYRRDITALQETRWQGKDIMNMKSHALFYSVKEKGTRECGVAIVTEYDKQCT
jgi:exonuclease III